MSQLDAQQDIEDTSTELSSGLLTVNFTRPIVSTDAQDTNLNACRYLVWTYGGIVDSFASPEFTIANLPKAFGTFDDQICLQSCAGMELQPSSVSCYNDTHIIISCSVTFSQFKLHVCPREYWDYITINYCNYVTINYSIIAFSCCQ